MKYPLLALSVISHMGRYDCEWPRNISELATAKYLSDSLGKKTVRTKAKTYSSGQSQSDQSSGESVNYGETGRSLLTPDEILNLGRDVAILLNPKDYPHHPRPVDYWTLPEVFLYLKKEYPQFYWEPPLEFDANPYVAGVRSVVG